MADQVAGGGKSSASSSSNGLDIIVNQDAIRAAGDKLSQQYGIHIPTMEDFLLESHVSADTAALLTDNPATLAKIARRDALVQMIVASDNAAAGSGQAPDRYQSASFAAEWDVTSSLSSSNFEYDQRYQHFQQAISKGTVTDIANMELSFTADRAHLDASYAIADQMVMDNILKPAAVPATLALGVVALPVLADGAATWAGGDYLGSDLFVRASVSGLGNVGLGVPGTQY